MRDKIHKLCYGTSGCVPACGMPGIAVANKNAALLRSSPEPVIGYGAFPTGGATSLCFAAAARMLCVGFLLEAAAITQGWRRARTLKDSAAAHMAPDNPEQLSSARLFSLLLLKGQGRKIQCKKKIKRNSGLGPRSCLMKGEASRGPTEAKGENSSVLPLIE